MRRRQGTTLKWLAAAAVLVAWAVARLVSLGDVGPPNYARSTAAPAAPAHRDAMEGARPRPASEIHVQPLLAASDAEARSPREVRSDDGSLVGTLTLSSRTGQRLAPGDGWIRFDTRAGSQRRTLVPDVVKGFWRIEGSDLAGCDELELVQVWSHGGPAESSEPFLLRGPWPAEPVLLQARQVGGTILRARDARTGLELPDARFLLSRNEKSKATQHPGVAMDARNPGSAEGSPFVLSEIIFQRESGRSGPSFFVGAKGFAWRRFLVDREPLGEQWVDLQPGGTLTVRVGGFEPPPGAELHVSKRSDGQLVAVESLGNDAEIELRGIAPGEVRVSAEFQPASCMPAILCEAQAIVLAGATAVVHLQLAAVARVETASASGDVFVPEAWGCQSLVAQLLPLGEVSPGSELVRFLGTARIRSDRPGFVAFRWNEPALPVGSHVLRFESPSAFERIDVFPSIENHFATVLVPPVELLVDVVDTWTGALIPDVDVTWQEPMPEGACVWFGRQATRASKPGQFRIRGVPGPIQVSVWDWRYSYVNTEFELGGREVSATLRLVPSQGVWVRLIDGSKDVPFPEPFGGKITPLEGPPEFLYAGAHDGERRGFSVSRPGAFLLDMGTLEGFEPCAPQRLEIASRQWRTVEVPLARAWR